MYVFIVMSKPACKKNVSPMEIPRDFPGAFSRQKMGKKSRFARCLPHENFRKLTGMDNSYSLCQIELNLGIK